MATTQSAAATAMIQFSGAAESITFPATMATTSSMAALGMTASAAARATMFWMDVRATDPSPPVAHADVNAVAEDGASSTVTGNLLANDALGGIADAILSVTNAGLLSGHYGTLTLNPDGSYSYVLNQTNPDVEALN